jgi:hypothetical protein
MKDEIEVWALEYELRQAIDIAVRWNFDSVNRYRTEQNPYSVFDGFLNRGRTNFELFSTQLSQRLRETQNWKQIGIDLNKKFLIGINQYIRWHEANKSELEQYQLNSPFTELYSIVESTKNVILQYFPEHANPVQEYASKEKIITKHYVLAYLIECHATGESIPIGEKSKLEQIGNERMGLGKGNTFYKNVNNITQKDLNIENNLIAIGGENWRDIILKITKHPKSIKEYIQTKYK